MTAFPLALIDGRVNFLYKRTRIPEAAGTQDFFGLNYYAVEDLKFILDSSKGFIQRSFPSRS